MNHMSHMESKGIFISVVMVNYNGLQYLKETIPPILNLAYSHYEFILVDNGSTDGSLEYIKSFDNIKLVQSPKLREKNFACNYAINKSRGEYILLMDNDALIQDVDILLKLRRRYTEETGVIGLSSYDKNTTKSTCYGNYLGFYFTKEKKAVLIKDLFLFDKIKIGFPAGQSLFISKKKWIEVGGYDEYLKFGGDDTDLGIKLWLMGYQNFLYSETVQIHLGLPERQDNNKYALKWKEVFYAHLYTIVKNYLFFNMIVTLIGYSIFGFLKSLKQSIQRKHLGVFLAFFKGYYLFLKSLPIAMKKRREMQSKRVIKNDIFLKIKPPII
jgi:glycosyltransferase involved in cell wall biosynthesis